MYQCVKQFGSIKTGGFWDVDRYIVNSDGERRKVIITNENNWLLLSMTDFENHFAQAKKPLTEQEYIQTCNTEQLAEWIVSEINERVKIALHDSELNDGDVDADFYMEDSDDWKAWLKQPHTQKE